VKKLLGLLAAEENAFEPPAALFSALERKLKMQSPGAAFCPSQITIPDVWLATV